jgi:hypothetical protein
MSWSVSLHREYNVGDNVRLANNHVKRKFKKKKKMTKGPTTYIYPSWGRRFRHILHVMILNKGLNLEGIKKEVPIPNGIDLYDGRYK